MGNNGIDVDDCAVIHDVLEVADMSKSIVVIDLILETINKLLVLVTRLGAGESKSSGVDGSIRVREGDGVVTAPIGGVS